MLSYMGYALAVGLCSMDAIGIEAVDLADRAHEAIQVGLHAVEYMAGITLKIRANLELPRHNKAIASLSFASYTKV